MTVENVVGRTWMKCPFEWGLDNYFIIESSQGRLILCDIVRLIDPATHALCEEILYRPVTHLETYQGDNHVPD